MKPTNLVKWFAAIALAASAGAGAMEATPVSAAPQTTGVALTAATSTGGLPGVALGGPVAGTPLTRAPISASYAHTPTPDNTNNLPPGNGNIMPSATIYYDFWLGTTAGSTYEGSAAGDTNYENLLTRFAQDLGGSQFHNLVTQYDGNNGTISNNITFGGSWVDTTNAYPHAGTTTDPLTDADIQAEVTRAVGANGWTEDFSHIVAVFTATGIQECGPPGDGCTFSPPFGLCAYHADFTDSGNEAIYAFMAFDNFTHISGGTCVAGQTGGDTDPNRNKFPNGDINADAEINTFSHELIEAETDVHPNDTWTGSNGEIGDACNFNFAPRNDNGADVFLNGHPYILQQQWSNAASTCAIDLPTNGFCSTALSNVCAPTTTFAKTVDNATPQVNSQIHYTLTLNNPSDTAAETNLTLTDTVPPGYIVSSFSAPGSNTAVGNTSGVTVQYDTLAVHQGRTVSITAIVPAMAGSAATNCGSLAGGDLLGTALPTQTTSPCATTTPQKIPTIVTYTGPTSGDYHDPVTVSATLTDNALNPLAGKTINFSLNGTESCSGVTGASGSAQCSLMPTPGEAAGSYSVTAAFSDTTDPVYDVSSTTSGFTVTKEETSITYTGPTVILAGSGGATLTAKLVEDGANDTDGDGGSPAPVPSQSVTLAIGSQSCVANTDASGNVSCTIPSVSVPLGPATASATFAGDSHYLPTSASTSVIVFAFPSSGAFVLGDTTAATAGSATVTWWGDTWWQLNALSGGTAPSSFKGFAGTISLPSSSPAMSCSGKWTTTGGNSPPPVSGVPSYMGVVVSSSVTKSGSTISGNVVHIVVVKVNPGYQPQPMFAGTGTIVATYC